MFVNIRSAKSDMEEKQEISTNHCDFDHASELQKRIQCLEDELTKMSAKVTSLEELLLLAENVLSRCTCAELQEQILSLLSSIRHFVPKTATVNSPTISSSRRVDAATQCDGKYFISGSVTDFIRVRSYFGHQQFQFRSMVVFSRYRAGRVYLCRRVKAFAE